MSEGIVFDVIFGTKKSERKNTCPNPLFSLQK